MKYTIYLWAMQLYNVFFKCVFFQYLINIHMKGFLLHTSEQDRRASEIWTKKLLDL